MRFEFDHKTGTMQPKKNEEIYFAQSQGGGLIVDDKKNNIKYVIQRDGRITKLFGSFDKDNLNLYDMRDARTIADRVRRLLGVDHKYTDFHYFLRGYHMSESLIQKCSDFLDESTWGDMRRRAEGNQIRREDDISLFDNEGLYDYIKSKYESRIPEFHVNIGYYTNKPSNEEDLLIQPYGRWKPLMFYVFYNDDKIEGIHTHFDKFTRWNFNILKQKYLLIPERLSDECNYNFKISEKDGTITNHTVIGIIDILVEDKSKILLESTWGDMRKRAEGDEIRKEDDRFDSDEGRLKLLNLIYQELYKAGYGNYMPIEPYQSSLGDNDFNTCPWVGCNDDNDKYSLLDFKSYKFMWTFDGGNPEECRIFNLFCGLGLESRYDKEHNDIALCFDFTDGDGDWQTLNYSFDTDTWFWEFNAEGELKANEVDDSLADILVIVTTVINKNTIYTKDWFLKQ